MAGVRLGIVVVDSCLMQRPFLDEVKRLAARRTKIRADRMLISATHTHSAPSVADSMVHPDPTYLPYLPGRIVQALAEAEANLEPAQVGWAVVNAEKFTALRRWIRRPDRIADDVFGNPTVRANMHARQQLGGRHRPFGSGGSRTVADFVSIARRPPDRGAGQLFHALFFG